MAELCKRVFKHVFGGAYITAAQKKSVIERLAPVEHALSCGERAVALLAVQDIQPDEVMTVGRLVRMRKMIEQMPIEGGDDAIS